jgi:hypothetical protein
MSFFSEDVHIMIEYFGAISNMDISLPIIPMVSR